MLRKKDNLDFHINQKEVKNMAQEREYRRFNPKTYQEKSKIEKEGPKRELNPPQGIDSLLEEIDRVVSGSELSKQYKQQGGQ